VVDEALPLCIGESLAFKEMIQVANWRMHTPDSKLLKNIIMEKKELAMINIKKNISRKHISLTTDHWTSLANENYSAVTLHLIDSFQFKAIVLSCHKHEGCAAVEKIQAQLTDDLRSWVLQKELLMAIVTDTAAKMNALGMNLESSSGTKYHYYVDHMLQLTVLKAYSGDAGLRVRVSSNKEEENVMSLLKKPHDLVSFINSSPTLKKKVG